MILSVDNIGIGVTNLGRSVEFYQRLGFAKAFENERGCTMVAGSAKLFLFVGAPGREPVARQAFELSLNPAGIDHVSFLVDNVDKTRIPSSWDAESNSTHNLQTNPGVLAPPCCATRMEQTSTFSPG